MATITKFPQSYSSISGTWSNPTYAYADDGSYATVSPSKSTEAGIQFYNFGFGIPTGSTINKITVNSQYKFSVNTSIASCYEDVKIANAWYATLFNDTSEPLTDYTRNVDYTNAALTLAMLNDNTKTVGLSIAFYFVRGSSNTAFTGSLDYVSVTVDYTPPTSDKTGSITDSNGDQFSYTGLKYSSSSNLDSIGDASSYVLKKGNTTSLLDSFGEQNSFTGLKTGQTTISDSIGELYEYNYAKTVREDYVVDLQDSIGDSFSSSGIKLARSPTITDSLADELTYIGKKLTNGDITSSDADGDSYTGNKLIGITITSSDGDSLDYTYSKTSESMDKTGTITDSNGSNESLTGTKTSYNSPSISIGDNYQNDWKKLIETGITDSIGDSFLYIADIYVYVEHYDGQIVDSNGEESSITYYRISKNSITNSIGEQDSLSYKKDTSGLINIDCGDNTVLHSKKGFNIEITYSIGDDFNYTSTSLAPYVSILKFNFTCIKNANINTTVIKSNVFGYNKVKNNIFYLGEKQTKLYSKIVINNNVVNIRKEVIQ